MRSNRRLVLGTLAALLCLGATACFTPVPPRLTAGVAGGIPSTEPVSYVPQEKLTVQFLASGYGGGMGLIGAAIDAGVNASRRKESEGRASKLNALVPDLDFRPKLYAAIDPVLRDAAWLKATELQTPNTPVQPVTAESVRQQATLVLGTDWYLSQNCRVLVVETGLGFYLPGQPQRPAASNVVSYHSAEIGPQEADEAIPLWGADLGAPLAHAAAEAASETARLLDYALRYMNGEPIPSVKPAKVVVRLIHGRGDLGINYGRFTLQGTVIEETPERIVFQTSAGAFLSLPAKGVEYKKS